MDMVTNHNTVTSDAKKETVSNSITNNLDTSTESGQLAADAGSVLTDHLFDKMDQIKEENEDKTEEEKKEAEEKFAEETAAGINSALNIVGSAASGTTIETEDLKNDFANVLESDVCVDSLNEITEDEEVKEKVQNVTANMDEETKNELKQQVQDKINQNPEKEEDYKKLAESLGIPLDAIPEGGLPEGWPVQ